MYCTASAQFSHDERKPIMSLTMKQSGIPHFILSKRSVVANGMVTRNAPPEEVRVKEAQKLNLDLTYTFRSEAE